MRKPPVIKCHADAYTSKLQTSIHRRFSRDSVVNTAKLPQQWSEPESVLSRWLLQIEAIAERTAGSKREPSNRCVHQDLATMKAAIRTKMDAKLNRGQLFITFVPIPRKEARDRQIIAFLAILAAPNKLDIVPVISLRLPLSLSHLSQYQRTCFGGIILRLPRSVQASQLVSEFVCLWCTARISGQLEGS